MEDVVSVQLNWYLSSNDKVLWWLSFSQDVRWMMRRDLIKFVKKKQMNIRLFARTKHGWPNLLITTQLKWSAVHQCLPVRNTASLLKICSLQAGT